MQGGSHILPFPPDLDERAQDLVDQFYEVASHRARAYALVPSGDDGGGMTSVVRYQPLAIVEIRAWLAEHGERGARRRALFDGIRVLDRVWRSTTLAAQEYA